MNSLFAERKTTKGFCNNTKFEEA